jgi:hypothetical protein
MENAGAAIEALAKVIAAAAVSDLGILALLALILGALAYKFFHGVHVGVRVLIFLVLFSGAAAFGAAVMAERNPTLAAIQRAPKIGSAKTTSTKNPDDAPVKIGVDLQCVEKRLKELHNPQEFSQDGGVGCQSAGISGRGRSNQSVVTFRAPPGYSIVGPVKVAEVSNIDGQYRQVEYVREGDSVVEARVAVSCRSESKVFGPGASMRIRLLGVLEKPVTEEQKRDVIAACSQ